MGHAPGPARRRHPYSPAVIAKVWRRGKPLTNQWSSKRAIKDPDEWRRDFFGYPIRFGAYGDRDSLYGWEIAPPGCFHLSRACRCFQTECPA